MATQTQTPPQATKPIPFVQGKPLLGDLSAYNSERLDFLLRITQECGDVGGMHFGAGPRICIGNYFSMMEGHLLLATLAQRVSFELASPGSVEPDPYHTLTIRPRGGLPVIVKRRELRSQESGE